MPAFEICLMGLFIYLAEWVEGASWNWRFWCVSVYGRLQNCACVLAFVCFVLSSWWSLTGITTRPKLYFLLDICCHTTFDLRNAAVATMHSNRCIHTSAHVHVFPVFDGRPEAMSASSCELLVLLTFLLS